MRQLKSMSRAGQFLWLEANRAQRFEGKMLSDFMVEYIGFRSQGDRADYTVEVKPHCDQLWRMEQLDKCATIDRWSTASLLQCKSLCRAILWSVTLPAGAVPLSLQLRRMLSWGRCRQTI